MCLQSIPQFLCSKRTPQCIQVGILHQWVNIIKNGHDAFEIMFRMGILPKRSMSMILYPQTCLHIIGGLPLAIEVTASYLYENKGKIQIWRETLDRLRRKLENGFEEAFKVSYGSLDKETRQIFLDIACFSLDWIKNSLMHAKCLLLLSFKRNLVSR